MSHSARTMPRTVLLLCFALINGVACKKTTAGDVSEALEANLAQGHATLNDMFREVEKLMEDTQHKLEEAVHKMDNESARSILYARDPPLNYRDESRTVRKLGNQSVFTVEKIDKVTDNKTGATHFSRTLIRSSGRGNEVDYACIIDEDCEKGSYCLYEMLRSQCLPCKAIHAPCMKDEECCAGQLCVWGQCRENATKGEAGSICQYQSDCSTELCCAFHKALLFPVCTPKPTEREHCHIHPNHLMELLSWDIEGEGPREHCPCARGLQCQPHGRGSLCWRS
ncbi:dickkopf-related protein 3a [Megalops cyprinoides]|uniref:dickkopf-related protein 3a n=1 Tax=Megalops cyprinoides TaxID=118141 RepID=UPI00186459A9|nr:dickkopf-related protein 3a [Megalops cyprinoides]